MPSEKPDAALVVRSTIRRKLISIVLVGIATTIVLVTLANSWREAARYAQVKNAEITGIAHVFASAVADAVAAKDRTAILKPLRAIGRIPSFSYARVDDPSGRILADLGAAIVLEESAELPIFLRSSLEVQVPVVKSGIKVGRLTVLVKTDDLRASLMEGLLTGLIAALLSGAMGVAIATRLQKRITDPLRKLTQTMFDVERTQNFEQIVDHSSDDETGVLINTFNHMLKQIRVRDDRLAQHREQLEHKVEERTHDLKIAKDTAEEANAAKSDFLATMSHEIRTPMNGMLVMAELLASANLTDKHRRYADVVVKSGQSLLTIINDILDFSKIESGKMELECIDLDPSSVVDDVLNLFWDKASTNGLDLAGYVSPDVPQTISGDPVRMNQILSNLVNNALKFTEHGHVKVSVGMTRSTSGSAIRFAVSDTGIGIAQDKLKTVFESFSQADQTTTRRFGGTGLGLAICKRLVTAMEGEISVSSVEGEGSEFSFSIAHAALSEKETPPGASQASTLGNAIVAVAGSATPLVLSNYLADCGVETEQILGDTLTARQMEGAGIILAEPDVISSLPEGASNDKGKPFVVCVSQLGDVKCDDLIRSGRAHDVLMRPISRTAITGLIERLENGAPRGRTLLERGDSRKLPSYPNAKILVADDSAINREVVTEALRQMDVIPDVVEDGAVAVEAAGGKQYDLIFMDCSMPEMDGFEATRRIRAGEGETGRRVPIIALTAHIAGSSADEWKQAGMDDYLTKPFRITDLVEAFTQYLPEEMRQAVSDTPSTPVADDSTTAGPHADSGQPPAIDEKVLCEAVGCEVGEEGELVLRVLTMFEEHGPPGLLKLAESAQNQGSAQIADTAHALKSMCRNIGAVRLGEACDRLESEAKGGHIENLTEQLASLQTELVTVLERIKQIRSAQQQPDKLVNLEM